MTTSVKTAALLTSSSQVYSQCLKGKASVVELEKQLLYVMIKDKTEEKITSRYCC